SSTSVTYVEDSRAPGAPVFTGTSPPSPSSSLTPTLKGNAEPGATVTIYKNAVCTQMAASGTATAAGTFAIGVTVAPNTTTTFYAAATDAAGNVSPCSSGIAYTNDNLPPATPVLSGTTPASPSANAHPLVGGASEAGSLVSVYGSAG